MLETILGDFVVITVLLFIVLIFLRWFIFDDISVHRKVIYFLARLYQIDFFLLILDIPIIIFLTFLIIKS